MSMSRNSAPADLATCGRAEVRRSQPKVPKTGLPARSFFLTGLSRIFPSFLELNCQRRDAEERRERGENQFVNSNAYHASVHVRSINKSILASYNATTSSPGLVRSFSAFSASLRWG